MEDSKDKVQENLLANGGRCSEWGYLNALVLLVFASGCEHLESKHSHIRKDNNQGYFLRTYLARSLFFLLLKVKRSFIQFQLCFLLPGQY